MEARGGSRCRASWIDGKRAAAAPSCASCAFCCCSPRPTLSSIFLFLSDGERRRGGTLLSQQGGLLLRAAYRILKVTKVAVSPSRIGAASLLFRRLHSEQPPTNGGYSSQA